MPPEGVLYCVVVQAVTSIFRERNYSLLLEIPNTNWQDYYYYGLVLIFQDVLADG